VNPAISPLHLAILVALSLLACPPAALAETLIDEEALEAATTLPAISVTADKTERALEHVPVSMSVIDGLDIERSGMTAMEHLEGRIPGLAFQPYGQRGVKAPVMRGMTAALYSFSSSVLMLADDVPMLMAQGFEHSFLDIDRVEALRGPQSTLYGRNAEAGVIAIHSRPMDDTARASVSGEFGSRDKRALRFATSTPLVPGTLYASLSGSWMKQDGYVRNTFTGRDEDDAEHKYLNFGLRWTPSAATDFVLRYTRSEYDDGATPWGAPGGPRREVSSNTPSWNDALIQTLSLNAGFDLAPGLRLRSITAWNEYEDKVMQDTDFTSADLRYIARDSQYRALSQELRLEGTLGRADWLVGAYGETSNNSLHNFGGFMGMRSGDPADWHTRAAAVFTHWNVPLNDTWSISAGARVERTSVEISPMGAAPQKNDWTHFSPKLALQYHFSPEHQWYISASRGTRAGGYNIFVPNLNYPGYAPEENWSYETGLKGFVLDQRLRYSIAAYYMDIENMQVMQQPLPRVNYISSAATATSKGLELDVDYLIGHALGGRWQVQSGVSWNHTRFDRFIDGANDYSGKHNPFAPAVNGHFGLRYDADLGVYVQAGVRGNSKSYLDAANQFRRHGYGLIDLVVGYQRAGWDIAAYARNAADKTYDATGYQGGTVTVYSPPREIGVRVGWRM